MRKSILLVTASLLLGGGAIAGVVGTTARVHPAVGDLATTVGLVSPSTMIAQNTSTALPVERGMHTPNTADSGARMTQRCEEHYAREVGRMAYLEARLNLTQDERSQFARWKEVRLDIAKRHAAECTQRIGVQVQDRTNPADRMSREEERLKGRVADLDAERPVFSALYSALTSEQRQTLLPDYNGMM